MNKEEIKEKCFLYCAYFLFLYSIFFVFGLKPYVVYKAKNPNNLVQGCLYFRGYSRNIGVDIDGFATVFHSVAIKEFPAGKKLDYILQKYPYDTKQCHRVTYVKVFVVYRNFHYPYDLIDARELTKDEISAIQTQADEEHIKNLMIRKAQLEQSKK